jgi:fluoride ion exporter CrcB/FEX
LITTLTPMVAGVPIATFGINVIGAFLLGVLLEFLADRSPDIGWSRRMRLAVGTGGLGGFTTYSALATGTVILATSHPGRALLTGLVTSQLVPHQWQVIIGTGLLGGYTTFSTASFETVRLIEDRRYVAAAFNGVGMLLICAAAAAIGFAAALLVN